MRALLLSFAFLALSAMTAGSQIDDDYPFQQEWHALQRCWGLSAVRYADQTCEQAASAATAVLGSCANEAREFVSAVARARMAQGPSYGFRFLKEVQQHFTPQLQAMILDRRIAAGKVCG